MLQGSQEISEETYRVSGFKGHKHLKLLQVTHDREALSLTELLYSNRRLLSNIRGHHSTQFEFQRSSKDHPDALAHMVDLMNDFVEKLY